MDRVLLDFGVFQLKWYSFFIFVAMLTACFLIFKESKKKNLNEDFLINLIFYGIIVGLIGARIYYVLFNLNYYLSTPLEIFMLWKGGLAIHGGIIAALLFVIYYTRKKNVDLVMILDILVVGVIIAQSIGRWGNFFNQEAYGRVISLAYLEKLSLPSFIINGMYISGYYREPTFLYESFFSFLGFIIMLILRKKKNLKVGQLTSLYLIWYGIERLIIEWFRSDSLMLGPIKVAQLISVIAIVSGLILVRKSHKIGKLYHKEEFD